MRDADADLLTPKARAAWERILALPPEIFPADPRDLAAEIGESTLRNVNPLRRAGLLTPFEVRTVRQSSPIRVLEGVPASAHAANQEQQRAIDGITETLGGVRDHLIHGVTGSGKTEVYIRVIERALDRGQTAIVLVPEIALTPQTAQRFQSRLDGAGVAVLHSGLTATQRHSEWSRASDGSARVVVGARSAVFAPLENLGVIVVDEEHDGSYKQDQGLDFTAAPSRSSARRSPGARRCSARRPRRSRATTTRSEAASRSGRYANGSAPGGCHASRSWTGEPNARRLGRAGRARSIGPRLEAALTDTLTRGAQAMLLVNRRGYAGFLSCADPACGWVQRCERCDASMVLHRGRELPKGALVRCHHCTCEQLVPRACPLCKGRLEPVGAGSQRVEDELERLFGERFGLERSSSLKRIDADTMERTADYFEALEAFASGRIRVLVGTQMIAKGHDFPNVELVGVVNADTALGLADFRASERTFQLVSQVAGRAGRGETPGLVIVQTMEPETPAIVDAASHDYERFARRELEDRRRAGLPPTTRMARIVCRDRDRDHAEDTASRVAAMLRAAARPPTLVDGPAPCPLERVADYYRFGVDIVARDARTLRDTLASCAADGLLKSDIRTAIDVDPVSLL